MLHCPATLLIARHGDATLGHDPARPQVMSDAGGWLTETGRAQVTALAGELRERRVAAAYTSVLQRASESGDLAAGLLDVRSTVLDGLEEVRVGECAGTPVGDPSFEGVLDRWVAGDLDARVPGAENGHEVLGRFGEALQTIADQYRGETVLVFSHGGVMSFAVPRLASNVRNDLAADRLVPHAVPATVEIGDDGWAVLDWPGGGPRVLPSGGGHPIPT